MPIFLENAVVRLFGDAGWATESSPDTTVIFVIQTVVNRTVVEAFQSGSFYSAAYQVVEKCGTEPKTVYMVSTRMIDAPAFSVSMVSVIQHMVQKSFLEKAKREGLFDKLAAAVDDKKSNEEDGILTKKVDFVWSSSPWTGISQR